MRGSPKLKNPTRNRWFDTSVFSPLPASDRSVPRTNPYNYPGVVGPSVSQVDMTMSKAFRLSERFRLEVRVEAYNAFNHINWADPVTSFTNSNFGKVTGKRTNFVGREVQYGFRVVF